MKVDMHTHTIYSRDSMTRLDIFRKFCLNKEIFPVITDHNTIEGALKYKKLYKDCIIGEEISTKNGEIIGLFLEETIPKGMGIFETIEKIHEQDGLVYLQHPFDRFRRKRLDGKFLDKIRFDIVEIFNSRTLLNKDNLKAREFAKNNDLLKGVGSDAHIASEIGASYVIIDDFNSRKEFLKNLKNAKFYARKSPIYVHAITKSIKLGKSFQPI